MDQEWFWCRQLPLPLLLALPILLPLVSRLLLLQPRSDGAIVVVAVDVAVPVVVAV